ncbi:thiol reductant ABC exporter subunit CydC [Chryseomicrobium palamuruense]
MKELISLLAEERKDVAIAIALGAVSGLTAIALFAQSGFLISQAALSPPFYTILILTAFLKLFGAVKSSSKYFERLISHRVTFQALSRIREHFFAQLNPLVPQIFTRYRSGDLLSRFVSDVEIIQNFFLRVVYPPLVTAVVFLATVFFTLFFSIWLALVMILGFLLVALVIPALFSERLRRNDVLVRRAAVATEAAEYIAGFRELKLHNQVKQKEQAVQQAQEAYIREQRQVGNVQLWSQTLNASVASLTAFGILAVGAYLVAQGELNGLFLAMLTLVALTSFETAVPIAGVPGHLHESRQALNRLQVVVDEQPPQHYEKLNQASAYSLHVQNVNYLYPEADRFTLKNLNLELIAGTRTALVGASGSGKSTLLQLLAGMASPTSGDIRVNHQSLTALDPESLWNVMGVQLQTSHFFYGTIRENLAIANPNAQDQELQDALEKAQFIIELDAPVFERGENLSGGEKQRLALARLFLTKKAIYLFDEPFTSLDYQTEKNLTDELWKHSMGSTIVLVSHKLSGLEQMDQIVVLDHGQIVEKGSYEELMTQKGVFYEMKQIESTIL